MGAVIEYSKKVLPGNRLFPQPDKRICLHAASAPCMLDFAVVVNEVNVTVSSFQQHVHTTAGFFLTVSDHPPPVVRPALLDCCIRYAERYSRIGKKCLMRRKC